MPVELEARYQALFETTPDAILIVDDAGTYVDVNPSLCRLLKATREELIGAHFSQFIPAELLDAARTDFGELKSSGTFEGEFPMRARDGSIVELEWTSRANFVPGLHFCVARDITERRRSAEAQQFLARAGELLTSALDYHTTLEHVARLVVPRLADWCTVHVLDEGGKLREVAVEHADPVKKRWAREIGSRYPMDLNQPTGVPHVLRTGEPALFREIPDELLVQVARGEEHLALLRQVGFRSCMIVPMCARDRVLGTISFIAAESGVHYGPPDLELAQELANRAAVAVDNARLYREAQQSREPLQARLSEVETVYSLSQAVGRATSAEEVYEAALDALTDTLRAERASILLMDEAGVMRFVAWRGLSDRYRAAVEEHSPWPRDDPDPRPLGVVDVAADASLAAYHNIILSENIRALTFVPLVFESRLLGKFMLYFDQARALSEAELRLAQTIANQIAFSIERHRAEAALRASELEFRTIFELAGSGTAQVDPATWRFTRVNRRFCEMLGCSEAEMIGRKVNHITHPDHRERDQAVADGVRRGELNEWQLEKRYVRDDGQVIWVFVTGRLIRDEAGRPLRAISTIHDITDRKRAEEGLREADRRKDDFLAMLAHELRNPLAPIRNALHLLRLQGGDPGRVERLREMLERQVGHMTRLIDDLLDVSRITRGKITLHRERLDLRQLIRTAVEDHRTALEGAGLTVELELAEQPTWVSGDATRLTQVIDNLLENAGKFTERGGSCFVRVAGVEGQVVLTVRDTGMGIEPGLLPQLFSIFTQADRTLDRSRGGLGLGLALIRGLVELHHGTVSAHSEGAGHELEFVIRLPRELEPPALAPRRPEPCAGGLTVLVIEDNLDAAESLRMLLEEYGCEVAMVHSGGAALMAARRMRPGVILCDIGLPGMDGYAVARALRADPETANLRLIALTGYGREEDIQRAREAGFDAHLTKPVEPDKLLGLLQERTVAA